jgi:hypothetical protein
MYKGVYAAMVDTRVAIELEEEVFIKIDGTITENEGESFGRKTKYILTKPSYCLYVDEVGCNTSQKSDGNVGGQKFVVGANQRALIRASHQDCHFTVLGFTNALGEAVCCIIILAGSEVRAKDVGDSAQQNGAFKSSLSEEKALLLEKKTRTAAAFSN